MEPVSLVLGVAAIPGAFFSIVQFLDTITLAKDYGHDSEVAFTEFCLLKARLEVWLESMAIESRNDPDFGLGNQQTQTGQEVRRAIGTLNTLFSDGGKLQNDYGLQMMPEAALDASGQPAGDSHGFRAALSKPFKRSNAAEDLQSTTVPAITDSPIIQSLREFTQRAYNRQQQASLPQKTKWAIIDKRKFDDILLALRPIIDSLEKLGDRTLALVQQRRSAAMQTMASNVQESEVIGLLQEAQKRLDATAERTSSSDSAQLDGHDVLRSILLDNAKAVYGDVGVVDPNARKHKYTETKGTGNSKAVFGNMDGQSFSDFMR